MIYTVALGENDLLCVSLDRKGSTYAVSTWDRAAHKMSFFEEFSSFAYACIKFFETCRENGVEPRKVEHDLSDFANID